MAVRHQIRASALFSHNDASRAAPIAPALMYLSSFFCLLQSLQSPIVLLRMCH
ncbi:hypothetical protein PVAP13_1NG128776 [Panicum virgatum]|uniref:Uncharacterized protein n=1 Tax=Panicum virgatum TaxID=38727 RepID=A0A8T0WX67_PANVG|nr:hypothetical protein PVAP13_1NG128776 [Panicum virgatum]